MSREVVVVSAVRTAIGTFGGSLKDIPPTALGATVVRESLARAGVDGKDVGHVVFGHVVNTEPKDMYLSRVAAINGAPYEADQHAPIALKEGVSQEKLDAMDAWEGSGLFSERERAVLAYTDAMTRQVQVPDAVFEAARAAMGSEKLVVELTATVAAYNMVSRFLEALQVHSHDSR